jgi:hypothetical protein
MIHKIALQGIHCTLDSPKTGVKERYGKPLQKQLSHCFSIIYFEFRIQNSVVDEKFVWR